MKDKNYNKVLAEIRNAQEKGLQVYVTQRSVRMYLYEFAIALGLSFLAGAFIF
jgi:hypothetical protein